MCGIVSSSTEYDSPTHQIGLFVSTGLAQEVLHAPFSTVTGFPMCSLWLISKASKMFLADFHVESLCGGGLGATSHAQ